MVVLDTSVIIDHLRQRPENSIFIKLAEKISVDSLAISMVTIQELYEGKSTKDQDAENFLLVTLSRLKILPYNYDVAELAGKLARDQKPIEFADSAIAATAIINGAQLFTLNQKDFKAISDLELYQLE